MRRSVAVRQKQWAVAMRKIFAAQEREVLAKLREVAQAKAVAIPEQSIDELLLNHATWDVILSETGRRIGEAVMMDAGNGVLQDLGFAGVSFDLDAPGARAFLNQRYGDPRYAQIGSWPKQINDTTDKVLREQLRDELREQLGEALTTGEGIDRVERRIRKVFGEAKSYRTERIARTEVNGCYNNGTFAELRDLDAAGKEWIAAVDGKARPWHGAAMDGKIVPLDQPFMVPDPKLGVTPMQHPHDFGAPGYQTINCRCTFDGVMSREEVAAAAGRAA